MDPSKAPDFVNPQSIFDLLGFRISEFYAIAGSLITRICEGEFGITREQWQFVAMLAALGETSPTELATMTSVARSQSSRTLGALEAKGLIIRRQMQGDRRRSKVVLSDAGQALYGQVFPRNVAVHRALIASLTLDDLRWLSRNVSKLHSRALEVQQESLVTTRASRRLGGSRRSWSGVA